MRAGMRLREEGETFPSRKVLVSVRLEFVATRLYAVNHTKAVTQDRAKTLRSLCPLHEQQAFGDNYAKR